MSATWWYISGVTVCPACPITSRTCGGTFDLAHEGGELERIDVLRCVHADAGDAEVPQVVDVLPEGVRDHEGVREVVHSPAHERQCSLAGMTPLRVEEVYEDDA